MRHNSRLGQQIALTTTTPATTTYDGPTLSPTWTVGGTNIGGYAPTSSANVTVTNNDNGLTSNPSNITLNGPASATVMTDLIIGQNLDGARVRGTTYQVYNLDKSIVGSIPIAEDYITSGWSCTNASQPTTNTTICDGNTQTDNNGIFQDLWSDLGTYYTRPIAEKT